MSKIEEFREEGIKMADEFMCVLKWMRKEVSAQNGEMINLLFLSERTCICLPFFCGSFDLA